MLDWMSSLIENKLEAFRARVLLPALEQIVTGIIWHSRIAVGSEGENGRNVLNHDVEGFDVDGQDDTGQKQQPSQGDVRAAELAGFALVPIPGEPCLVLGWGANIAVIPLASEKYRPKGLKQGEVVMYNLADTQGLIKIDKAGKVTIDAEATQDVVINGGDKPVSRKGDTTDSGTLVISGTVMPPVVTAIAYYPAGTPPAMILPPPLVGPPAYVVHVPLLGKITSGAANFKG